MPRLRSMPPRMAMATTPHALTEAVRYGLGRGGRPWRRTVERIKARAHGLCEPCGREGNVHIGHECDHVIPLSQGGTDDDSNLQWICRTAHAAKTARESHGQ